MVTEAFKWQLTMSEAHAQCRGQEVGMTGGRLQPAFVPKEAELLDFEQSMSD